MAARVSVWPSRCSQALCTRRTGHLFHSELIDLWRGQKKFTDFINYDKVEEYRHFGGIRNEEGLPHHGDRRTPTGQENPADSRGGGRASQVMAPLNPNRSSDRFAVCLAVFLRLSKPFRLAAGILSAALSRRSPLRLRQRRQPIYTAARRNRFDSNGRFGLKPEINKGGLPVSVGGCDAGAAAVCLVALLGRAAAQVCSSRTKRVPFV